MTEYEIRRKTEDEETDEVVISGVTLTITRYGRVLRVSTSPNLTAAQENTLKAALASRGFKIIWKDGVVQP